MVLSFEHLLQLRHVPHYGDRCVYRGMRFQIVEALHKLLKGNSPFLSSSIASNKLLRSLCVTPVVLMCADMLGSLMKPSCSSAAEIVPLLSVSMTSSALPSRACPKKSFFLCFLLFRLHILVVLQSGALYDNS